MKNQAQTGHGLLFYLSGNNGSHPEVALGNPVPNFFANVEIIPDGKCGKALRCLPNQLLAYWAPGNIYAQRGTVAFFWRSRYPLGPTEFPIFRVGYADHSSWDAQFMRIDYNGGGIDAFVTDINLSRTRVTMQFATPPQPEEWFHIAFAWDETAGVRLYIDGRLTARQEARAIYYAGLDQFGTHSRIISHWQVQSSYNYVRTGDFDEIRIYDRMLEPEQIAALAAGNDIGTLPPLIRPLHQPVWQHEWLQRWGFDSRTLPAPLRHDYTAVHKVEIHNAWDLKRWWWKACDGIRETTWPGVYNRSRLPGRTDYFVLPDWDCYSQSGREITFEPLADTDFNHIEISGSAQGVLRIHGRLEEHPSLYREAGERSVHRLPEPVRNVSLTFTNDVIEEPIGDITLLQVEPGMAPPEARRESFGFAWDTGTDESGAAGAVRQFVRGRFMADERATMIGVPDVPAAGAGSGTTAGDRMAAMLPLLHLVMAYEADDTVGMDGLVLKLPALRAEPTHGQYLLVNVQVKDPLWLYRNLIQFTFAVLPGAPKEIWLDTRDRILPQGKALYATIAFSGPVAAESLSALRAEIVYKPAELAKAEHIADRWIQVKDNYAHLVEENPSSEKFNLYNRFVGDLRDLLRICPEHRLGRLYWFDKFKENAPAHPQTPCPPNVPRWAWRQVEYLGYVKRYLRWWIDKRQIANGEFGGGLSDDGDLTAWWPGPALAGCMPQKIKDSLLLEMEAFYDQGMFANGLCAIQTDQLHTLEEGIQALGQCLTLDPCSPKHLERAMENARGLFFVTGYNAAGHRHLKSGYYSGTRMAEEAPWNYSASDSFHVLHPTYMLVRYNGSPVARKLILELADAMMDHYRDGRLHVQIDLATDQDQVHERTREWPLFYAAWQFTGDEKYLRPISETLYAQAQDRLTGDPGAVCGRVAEAYERLITSAALREYINTDGQLWVDRGVIDIGLLQEHRIGGIGHERFSLYPRHYIRWEFAPGDEENVAILVTYASPSRLRISAWNLTDGPIDATLTGEAILPGQWRFRQGRGSAVGVLETVEQEETSKFERFMKREVRFAPGGYTVLELDLEQAGTPYWERPDLAIDREDVLVSDSCIRVRVHNIGAAASPLATLALKAPDGTVLRSSQIPPLPAPADLYPKVVEIPLWTRGLSLEGCVIEIDPEGKLEEITRENNCITL
jgi:hypothetical protein